MDNLIALLGMLFFMFLVLAATVEVILEMFRGGLEWFGITWAKGKVPLEDALKLSAEFAPNSAELNTKLQAVKSTAEQITKTAAERLKAIEQIEDKINSVAGAGVTQEIAAEIIAIATAVRSDMEASERRRIFILRGASAAVGFVLVVVSEFHVFRLLAEAPETKTFLASFPGLQNWWINNIVGGLAAAAGSSYWHDKLDKVRNLKSLSQESQNLKT